MDHGKTKGVTDSKEEKHETGGEQQARTRKRGTREKKPKDTERIKLIYSKVNINSTFHFYSMVLGFHRCILSLNVPFLVDRLFSCCTV